MQFEFHGLGGVEFSCDLIWFGKLQLLKLTDYWIDLDLFCRNCNFWG